MSRVIGLFLVYDLPCSVLDISQSKEAKAYNMITALKGLDLVKETQPHLRYRTNFQSIAVYHVAAAAAAKSLQSCPTLCDPIDGSPPGSAVPGILQARILEWVAISFSNA